MKNLFSIGEVSKIKEITIKALRYYHKEGILIPKCIDEETGYRYYSIDQFIYIDIIKGCRELGTSIKELKEIFKACDTEKALNFLNEKKAQAKQNIIKMNNIIKSIDELNFKIEKSKRILKQSEVEIKEFEERNIIVVPCMEVGKLRELIYYSELEKIMEEFKIENEEDRGIIYDIEKNGEVEPKYVFSIIKEKKEEVKEEYLKVLPKGKYLTLSYEKENEEMQREKLDDYIKKNNIKVKKFIEIDLIDDFFDTESYSCQIQILI